MSLPLTCAANVDSSAPPEAPDHSNYSFRAMLQDQVEVMHALG
jgi:haloacetate dehalogenase